MYDGYLQRLAERFDAAFNEIEAEHNFDLGPEFEVALCKVLRRALPNRFGIARGFVVDENDETAGDDIVIFEQTRFATVTMKEDGDYSRKEKIPIEAVYAYIEAKHTVHLRGDHGDGQSLTKAIEQATKVKKLCSTRKPVNFNSMDGVTLGDAFEATPPIGFPSRRNPMFCAILARRVRDKKGGVLLGGAENPTVVREEIRKVSMPGLSSSSPDLFVLGRDTAFLPTVASKPLNLYQSPFLTPTCTGYTPVVRPGLAFAVGMASLMFALDWIRLGRMEWSTILQHEFSAELLRPGSNDG